jgi:hypothetical protein
MERTTAGRPWPDVPLTESANLGAVAVLRHGVERPLTRDAFQGAPAAVEELEAGSGDQVPDRSRDKDLSAAGFGRDARTNHHREACELALVHLALTDVDADSGFESERFEPCHDCLTAADRSRRPVERREEPVSGRIPLLTAESPQLASHHRVVAGE